MEARLRAVETGLVAAGTATRRGGPTDRWDLETRVGMLGGGRLLGTVEEHGHGRQMVRWRLAPGLSGLGRGYPGHAHPGGLALKDGGLVAGLALAAVALGVGIRSLMDVGGSIAAMAAAVEPSSDP